MQPTKRQGLGQLRPVGALAGFDLDHLADDRPPTAVQEAGHRGALGFKAEAGGALRLRRHPEVGHEFAVGHGPNPLNVMTDERLSKRYMAGNGCQQAAADGNGCEKPCVRRMSTLDGR